MKNGVAKEFAPFRAVYGGNVKNAVKLQIFRRFQSGRAFSGVLPGRRLPDGRGDRKVAASWCINSGIALGVLVSLGAGSWIAGCKSAPDLTEAQALTMIQAKYDQTPAEPVSITVKSTGMVQGVTAKYWFETKRYPNGYWGDFTVTPDGKKVLKLAGGGDVIQWRPDNPTDPNFVVVIQTLATNHLKARDVGQIQSVADTRIASFTEDVNLDGVPEPLENIAHNPGNKLSSLRQATFVLTNGAWTLQSIE
jgi:hypothetical protein